MASIEFFVVCQDEPLVGGLSKVRLHPFQLVRPGRGVVPGGSREHVSIEPPGESIECCYGILDRPHLREDSWDLIETTFKALQNLAREMGQGR